MPAAAAAILDGMPDARDLHRLDTGGQTMIFAGSVQLFQYAEDDTAARNVAVAVLRQLGFGGEQVAAVMQLTPNYVATLRQRSLRDGTAGLIRPAGRPRETADASWEQARAWRAEGMRDAEIARRLRVNQSTVLRRLGRAHLQEALPLAPEPAAAEPGPAEPQVTEPQVTGPEVAEPEAAAGTEVPDPAAGPRPVTVSSRYAGTMLLHAFFARAAAGPVLAAARRPGRGPAADRGQHVLRARSRDGRAVQAPGRRGGRAAGRLARTAGAAGAAPGAGRHRGPDRPAGDPVAVRGGDARRRPGGLRRVLRR